ncbi:hypothetical protein KC19_10G066200 [Ceratodon purpureus]|uniref:BRO1 domain-containing protein n=1 Tax=Ceratodon purpureus TaxID=3225 RepID=A0A8T0GL32_CERPU|nr:hypothetical protein KC19_10G066200 [Ceratodon purpureus]
MLLHFRDPAKLRTKTILYEESFYARDSGTLEQLKELSSRRQAIQDSINGISTITPVIAREMAGGITSPVLQKIERYLPLLENLVTCVVEKKQNRNVIQWTSQLAIRWTSPLSGQSGRGLKGPRYFQVDDMRYELGMTLNLYGALLRERALEVVCTDKAEAATLFRRASGVYVHLAKNVLPPLKASLPPESCPEVTPTLASIMSIICLAEAQAVTVKKAEEKAASGSLLAKLHYGVVQFLDEAELFMKESCADLNDISGKLKKFIRIASVLHESRSQRYIAAEYTKIERFGVAVGVLRYSLTRVLPLRPGFQWKSYRKFFPTVLYELTSCLVPEQTSDHEKWRLSFQREQDDLQNMLRKCENENEFIWHEKTPDVDELPTLEGTRIVQPIPYKSFGLDREFVFVT